MPTTVNSRRGRKSRDFQERRERFDTAWQGTATPVIENFLPSLETAESHGYSRRQLLVELIEIDLECRWKAGFPRSHFDSTDDSLPPKPRIEDYLAQFPDLGAADDVPIDLVVEEFKARRLAGEVVDHEEYLVRFPSHAEQLRPRLRDAETDLTEPTARFVRCPQCHVSVAVPDLTAAALEVVTCACGEKIPIIDDGPGHHREGELLGDYLLVRWLGRGSFANVWLAFDQHLERHVALKIPYARGKGEKLSGLLRKEARIAADLHHDHIVTVYELGKEDCEYIASEYVKGHSLDTALRANRWPPEDVAKLCRDVADALDYLHNEGIVHRDVKPSNILLDEHGEPKLTDFGLAKRDNESIALSSAGELIGTVAYMSPEQAAGKGNAADRRSDIFSLGIVMYEMLAGTLPFHGDRLTIMNKIQKEEPDSILKHAPKTPRDLQTLCFKCLEKEPSKRFATAAELAAELGRYLRGEPILSRPASLVERLVKWAKRHPARAIAAATSFAAAAAIVVAVGLVAWQYVRDKEFIDEQRKEVKASCDDIQEKIANAAKTKELELLQGEIARIRKIVKSDARLSPLFDDYVVPLDEKYSDKEKVLAEEDRVDKWGKDVESRLENAREHHKAAMAYLGWVFPSQQDASAEPDHAMPLPNAATAAPPLKFTPREKDAQGDTGDLDSSKDAENEENDPDALAKVERLAGDTGRESFIVPPSNDHAMSNAEDSVRLGLSELGIALPGAETPQRHAVLWTEMQELIKLGPEFDPRDIQDARRIASELILLLAEITYRQANDAASARQALATIEVAPALGLDRDGDAIEEKADGRKIKGRVAKYAFRRLRDKYAGTATPLSSQLPSDATAFDHFVAGCEWLSGSQRDGRPRNYEEAYRHFDKAFHKDSDHDWTAYFMALCAVRLGDYSAADKALATCSEDMQSFPWARLLRNLVWRQTYLTSKGQDVRAFHEAEKLLVDMKQLLKDKQGSDNADRLWLAVQWSLGALYFDAARSDPANLDRAAECFLAVVKREPSNVDAYANLAVIRREQKDILEAERFYTEAIKRAEPNQSARLYFDRAEIHLAKSPQDYDAAAKDFAVAAERFTGAPDKRAAALTNLAWIRGVQLGDADGAISLCNEALAGEGQGRLDTQLVLAALHDLQARSLKRQAAAREEVDAHRQQAIGALDAYLAARRDSPRVFEFRAKLRVLSSAEHVDLAGAAEDYRMAAALYRRAAEAHANPSDERTALEDAERSALRLRGACLSRLGEADQAIEALDRAIDDLGDVHFATHIARGFARVLAAQTKKRADFQRALADAEWVALLTDDAYELYEAAGIYALAAGRVAYAKGPLGNNFKPWGERSLALLRRALMESAAIDAQGRYTHPKAVKIRQFGGSPTFRALQNLDEYLPLMGEYARPSQRSGGVAPPKLASGREGDTR